MRATQFKTQARGEGGPDQWCAPEGKRVSKHTAYRHKKKNDIMLPET
jgi:hypothetical protein